MSAVNIDIQRLQLSLHGISAQVVEQAMSGLEDELQRRLGARSWTGLHSLAINTLNLPAVKSDVVLDAAGLRGLIADRLTEALLNSGENN